MIDSDPFYRAFGEDFRLPDWFIITDYIYLAEDRSGRRQYISGASVPSVYEFTLLSFIPPTEFFFRLTDDGFFLDSRGQVHRLEFQ